MISITINNAYGMHALIDTGAAGIYVPRRAEDTILRKETSGKKPVYANAMAAGGQLRTRVVRVSRLQVGDIMDVRGAEIKISQARNNDIPFAILGRYIFKGFDVTFSEKAKKLAFQKYKKRAYA